VANYQLPVGGYNRWGDYSTTTVDPLDPSRFWTIQEYPSAPNVWSTAMTEIIVTETPPQLNLAAVGGQLQASWPTNEIGFQLQSTTNLAPAVAWTAVSNSVVVVGDQNTVIVNPDPPMAYFRLIRP